MGPDGIELYNTFQFSDDQQLVRGRFAFVDRPEIADVYSVMERTDGQWKTVYTIDAGMLCLRSPPFHSRGWKALHWFSTQMQLGRTEQLSCRGPWMVRAGSLVDVRDARAPIALNCQHNLTPQRTCLLRRAQSPSHSGLHGGRRRQET